MNDYNALIAAKILDGYEEMLDKVPQPQMLGGKRMRNFVLPGSTEHDYPGTLSVGTMDGKTPQTLAGAFFKDFNQAFPVEAAESLQGGVSHPEGMPRRVGGKFNIKKVLKSVGKSALPVAKDVAMLAAKEGVKEGVKSAAKSGGRRKKPLVKSAAKVLKAVGKEVAPVAKEVFHDVIVPEGKKALREYIKSLMEKSGDDEYSGEVAYAEPVPLGKGRKPKMPKKMVGTDPRTFTPQHLLAQGGALIKDQPSEFHSSVYPPALASYAKQMPKGKDAYGRGRDEPAKPKRTNARGKIVAEIMKKHGLSLAEASKMVKEKGLY